MRVALWMTLIFFPVLTHTSDWANVGWKVSGLLEGIFNSIKDDKDVEPGSTNLPVLLRKAGGIAKFMGVVGPMFALLSVVLPGDHQFEQIMAEFEIVNQELDKLGRDIDNLEEQLKYESAKTQIHGDFSKMEGAVDLFAIYSNVSNDEVARNTSRDSLMLMETELMLAINDVLKGQNGENEFASTNLFKSIYATTNGDLTYLAMVSDTIHGTVVNAILAYHSIIYIKYSEEEEDDDMREQRAQDACRVFDKDMEKMQNLMADYLERCETQGSVNVMNETDNYGHYESNALATKIESQLQLKYYWFNFVVIVYPGRNPRDYSHHGHKYYRKYKDNEIVVMFKEVSVPTNFVETKWLYETIASKLGCWKVEFINFLSPPMCLYYRKKTTSNEIKELLQKEFRNAGIEVFGISVVQLIWKKGDIGPVFWKHSNIGSSVYTLELPLNAFGQKDYGWYHVTVALQNTHYGSSPCPSSHPYLYNYGQGCCKESSESGSQNSRPPCDRSDISYTSRCCENSVDCTGWGGCKNALTHESLRTPGAQSHTSLGALWIKNYFSWKDHRSCQFPFIYKGIEFTECSTMENFGLPWCTTKTDNGSYVDGEWGYCSSSSKLLAEESIDMIAKYVPEEDGWPDDWHCLKDDNTC